VPELPEVESVRRQLAPQLVGRRVVGLWWDPHPQARLTDVDLLSGRRVDDLRRRGKYLLAALDTNSSGDDLELVLHLGMTGSLRVVPTADEGEDPDTGISHVRARFDLDDCTTVLFRDPRRFGRISPKSLSRALSTWSAIRTRTTCGLRTSMREPASSLRLFAARRTVQQERCTHSPRSERLCPAV
jgi:formamidopyrimidine-DNA glycosylase